jgi:hypothetical protein
MSILHCIVSLICNCAHQDGANWIHPPLVPNREQCGGQADGVRDDVEEVILHVCPDDLILERTAVEHVEELDYSNRGHAGYHPKLLIVSEIFMLLFAQW